MHLTMDDFKKLWLFYCNPPLGWCQKPAQDTLRMFDQNPNTNPRSTPYYRVSVGMVSKKRWWHDAKTAEDCVKRTLYLRDLRRSIEREGIKEPITIHIKRNGKIWVEDGYHRLFCADYIDFKKAIPVSLVHVDPKFKAIETLMLKLGSGKNTYHPIEHPYFRRRQGTT